MQLLTGFNDIRQTHLGITHLLYHVYLFLLIYLHMGGVQYISTWTWDGQKIFFFFLKIFCRSHFFPSLIVSQGAISESQVWWQVPLALESSYSARVNISRSQRKCKNCKNWPWIMMLWVSLSMPICKMLVCSPRKSIKINKF